MHKASDLTAPARFHSAFQTTPTTVIPFFFATNVFIRSMLPNISKKTRNQTVALG